MGKYLMGDHLWNIIVKVDQQLFQLLLARILRNVTVYLAPVNQIDQLDLISLLFS